MTMTALLGSVRATVALIPAGVVATYGDIGRALGLGPRQVGQAMSLLDEGVPWHRVVHADGTPASCHGGQARALLCAETTPMAGSRVDMRVARWDLQAGTTADGAGG